MRRRRRTDGRVKRCLSPKGTPTPEVRFLLSSGQGGGEDGEGRGRSSEGAFSSRGKQLSSPTLTSRSRSD